jgi:hypothetical protein
MEMLTQAEKASRQADAEQSTGSCCRFCDAALKHAFVDLGMSPLCESYVSAERKNQMEPFYPLHVFGRSSSWSPRISQSVPVLPS